MREKPRATDREARIGGEMGDVLHRHAVDQVEIPRQQPGDAVQAVWVP